MLKKLFSIFKNKQKPPKKINLTQDEIEKMTLKIVENGYHTKSCVSIDFDSQAQYRHLITFVDNEIVHTLSFNSIQGEKHKWFFAFRLDVHDGETFSDYSRFYFNPSENLIEKIKLSKCKRIS